MLLEAGADANHLNARRRNGLHVAAHNAKNAAIICLLLRAGTNPTALDADGRTPAEVAEGLGHSLQAALLSRAAADFKQTTSASTLPERAALDHVKPGV